MKKLKITPVLYLTLGWFGIQMAIALDATQFQVMLDRQINNAFLIGMVLSLGPLAGITVQPLIGWYSDILAKKGLSREVLMKIGTGMALLSILILSTPMGLPSMITAIGLFFVSFNILIVTYRATVTETSNRKALSNHKGTISGFIALFSGAGSFAMFALCSVMGSTPYPFWIATVLLLITMVMFFRFAPKARSSQSGDTMMQGLCELLHGWNLLFYAIPFLGCLPWLENRISKQPHQKHIFRLFVVVYFAWIGIQALRGYFVLYASKSLHLSLSMANILLAILTLAMVAAAVPLGKLADRVENRLLLRYSLVFFAGVCFLGYFFVNSTTTAIVMSALLGVSFAGMIVSPLSLLFKLCPPQREGLYAGLYNLFISTPQLYSLLITGWLIQTFDDYHVILLVATVAVALGFLASYRMQPINAEASQPNCNINTNSGSAEHLN